MKNKTARQRNNCGQAFMESTGILMLATAVLIAGMALLVMLAQVNIVGMKLQNAAESAAQELLNVTTWAVDGTPYYTAGTYYAIEKVLESNILQMGLKKGVDGWQTNMYQVREPVATGVPGRYVFTVVVTYKIPLLFGFALPASALTIKQIASVVNNPKQAHQLAWLYDSQAPGDPCWGTSATQESGTILPVYGGGIVSPNALPPDGTYTQYSMELKGNYMGSFPATY